MNQSTCPFLAQPRTRSCATEREQGAQRTKHVARRTHLEALLGLAEAAEHLLHRTLRVVQQVDGREEPPVRLVRQRRLVLLLVHLHLLVHVAGSLRRLLGVGVEVHLFRTAGRRRVCCRFGAVWAGARKGKGWVELECRSRMDTQPFLARLMSIVFTRVYMYVHGSSLAVASGRQERVLFDGKA